MSTARFAKSTSNQYSDLFVRRSDAARQYSGLPDRSDHTQPSSTLFRVALTRITYAWRWIERKRTQQSASRRLRITETVSLGEKRFVSILEVNGARYLIGGAANQISLLAVLDPQGTGEKLANETESKGREA